jgi:hypothetical protein
VTGGLVANKLPPEYQDREHLLKMLKYLKSILADILEVLPNIAKELSEYSKNDELKDYLGHFPEAFRICRAGEELEAGFTALEELIGRVEKVKFPATKTAAHSADLFTLGVSIFENVTCGEPAARSPYKADPRVVRISEIQVNYNTGLN